jgi:hypothetical protein
MLAPDLTSQLFARRGGGRRFAVGCDDIAALQLRGETVHKARADNRMELQFLGQGLQEGAPLHLVNRRRCRRTARYSSSLRLSGMGRSRSEGQARRP